MAAPSPTDYIDAVNNEDQVIGQITRAEAGLGSMGFRTVHVLAFDLEGSLVLQRLAKTRKRNSLKLGSSVAGYLHAGESYEAAATRRMREELGVEADLHWLGTVRTDDGNGFKHTGIYTTRAEEFRNQLPEQIDSLVFLTLDQVRSILRTDPDQVTATTRTVLTYSLPQLAPA